MQNSVGIFTFFCFRPEFSCLVKFYPKNKIVSLSRNLLPRLILNMYNPMVVVIFTFSVLDRKHPVWANLVQKSKIFSLSWHLVSRLTRMCRIQWWCSLFLFWTGSTLFLLHLRSCGSRDFEIDSCSQHGFFIFLRWVHPWICFCALP